MPFQKYIPTSVLDEAFQKYSQKWLDIVKSMPGGVYKDEIFCGDNALYVDGDGNDWPNTVWRSLEDLSDESGKPVRG